MLCFRKHGAAFAIPVVAEKTGHSQPQTSSPHFTGSDICNKAQHHRTGARTVLLTLPTSTSITIRNEPCGKALLKAPGFKAGRI